ncbi:MAG: hypothetical protein ACR2IE_18600 [Candidatus Sumerlaeaceae bacterium]
MLNRKDISIIHFFAALFMCCASDVIAVKDLRFDYALYGCPCYVSTNCFCQEHFDHLNWVSTNGHYLQTTTDNQLSGVTANGNGLAAYWNDLNTGWTYTSSAQHADNIHSWVTANFVPKPTWLTLNEISAGTWPGNQAYRTWLVGVVDRLKNTHGYSVVLYSPFANPGANGADWQAVTQHCYIGIENYLSGEEVKAQNFSVAWCQAQYQSSKNSYMNLGVPASKLFLAEHFSHTVAGTGWGRAGISYAEWDKCIIARMTGLRNVGFPGVLTYAWRGNGMAVPVADMIHFIDTYAAQALPGPLGLPPSYVWSGGNGAYGTASNWTPARNTPAASDVLVFDGSVSGQGAPTVTISGNETISQMRFIQNVNVTFVPTAASTITCQSTGAPGSGNAALQIEAGTRVTLAGVTANAPVILALGASSFGYVDGDVWFNNGDATIYNRIASLQAGGLSFRATAKCYVGGSAAIAGGCFGQSGGPAATTSVNDGVVFNTGAEYHHQMRPDGVRAAAAYAFPHQLTAPASMVTWQSGSNFILWANSSAAFAGRSFADLTFRSSATVSVSAPTSVGNLNIESNGTGSQFLVSFTGASASAISGDLNVAADSGGLRLAASGARNVTVAGNVNVGAAGKLGNTTANDTLVLNGTAAQSAGFAGSTIQKLQINNSSGVSLASDLIVSGLLDLTAGELITSGSSLTAPDLTGLTRISGFVRGTLTRDIGTAPGVRGFPVGTAAGYSPVDVNLTVGSSTAGKLAIGVTATDHPGSLAPTKSINRYWTLTPATLTGFTGDITFTYRDPTDISGISESALKVGRNTGANSWQMFTPTPLNTAANTATAMGVIAFSGWTLGESTAFVPAIIEGWELY